MQHKTNLAIERATAPASCKPLLAFFNALLAIVLVVGFMPITSTTNAYADESDTTSSELSENSASGDGDASAAEAADGGDFSESQDETATALSANSDKSGEGQEEADTTEGESDDAEEEDEYAAEKLGEENSWRYLDGELIASTDGASPDSSSSNDMLSLSSVVTNSGGYKVFNWFDKFSKGYCTGTDAYKGIDVSYHNGTIDWAKVKAAGVDYAIIRCGYGMDETSQDDSQWVNNVKGCIANGIPFGVYIYSYATNTTRAASEAEHVLRCLTKAGITVSDLSYPIYFDMEDSSTVDSDLAAIATTFCNKIEAAGGTVGIYSGKSWFENKLTDSCFNNWTKWVAQWNASSGLTCKGLSDFESGNGMWQFSDYGSVSGISTKVDLDYTYMEPNAAPKGNIVYCVHAQDYGWMSYKTDGQSAGTTGKSKRLESIKISRGSKISSSISGSISYRVHVQDVGWQDWVSDGAAAGTTGKSKRLEAIQIKLTGELANKYDIYYRVHAQDYGWLGWTKNGESAGTEGMSKRLESIQIVLCEKGTTPSGYDSTATAFYQTWLTGSAHVQNIGWKSYTTDSASATLSMGTTGQSKRLEGVKISLPSSSVSGATGSIRYKSHIQNIGWQDWKSNGALSGTTGQSKRLEAIQIELTGNIAKKYDIYYRVHAQDYGWLGWTKNGESAGTEGYSKRLEKVEIRLVAKGTTPSWYDSSKTAFVNANATA